MRLSSQTTPYYQIGLVAFLVLFFGIFWVVGMRSSQAPSSIALGLGWCIGIGAALLAVCHVGRARRVDLEGDCFIVTGWTKSIRISVRDVEEVGGTRFLNPERMWLRLRRPSEFGSVIHFLPPVRLFHGLNLHPLVSELQTLISNSEASHGTGKPIVRERSA